MLGHTLATSLGLADAAHQALSRRLHCHVRQFAYHRAPGHLRDQRLRQRDLAGRAGARCIHCADDGGVVQQGVVGGSHAAFPR